MCFLAEALLEIIENEELRENMAAHSRKDVLPFDSKVISDEYIELYRKYR